MSERGVFAVDRGIWEHTAFKPEAFTEREAWMWMVGAAAWKQCRVRVGRFPMTVQRGQLAFSERFLAQRWRWSKSHVHRFLNRLETEAMVSVSSDHEANLITICNYEKYAFDGTARRSKSGPATEPVADQPRTKEEEGKEIEEVRNKKKERAPRGKPRTPIAEDWAVSEKGNAYARKSGFDQAKIVDMGRRFFNHHTSRGSLMADWEAAWRTWCDNEIKFNANRSVIPMRGPPNKPPTFHEIARNLSGTPDDEPSDKPEYDLDLRANFAH